MKLANVEWQGKPAVAVAAGQDSLAILPQEVGGLSIQTTDDVIAHWDHLRNKISEASSTRVASDTIRFRPAVLRPSKIFCIGLNYRQHAEETHSPIPTTPVVFSKFSNTLAAHLESVPLPTESQQVDYEAELAIVIGKPTRHVTEAHSLDYAFGYMPANDVSARDLQHRTGQWLLGKSSDKFAPIGPYITTADEVGDPDNLAIGLTLNGQVRQSSNTRDMIFSNRAIIAYLSRFWTLEPGDIILTGTPQGVIAGYPPEQQVWLKPGDVTVVEIEKLGRLETRFISA